MDRTRTTRQPGAPGAAETPVGGWIRGIRNSGFSFVMMGILVLAVVVLAPALRTFAEQRQEIDRLKASVADQQESVDHLKTERERWNDRTYITTQARDRLSYVLPGDISFLVINDLALPVTGGEGTEAVSTDIQSTDVNWLTSVFASVMTAGLTPEEASK